MTATVARKSNRGSKPGERRGGRKKGTPNKVTAIFKDAIVSVYVDLQKQEGGGNKHFLGWAASNPTEYYKLASKLIPVQVGGDPDNPIVHEIRRTLVRPRD